MNVNKLNLIQKADNLREHFEQVPSPRTYYTKFNKNDVNFNQYYKSKNESLWVWNQKFQPFKKFDKLEVFDEKMKQRCINLKKDQERLHQQQQQEQEQMLEHKKGQKQDRFLE